MTVSFCAIGECMIEISGTDAVGYKLGFAGDTFNTTWYVRALLPKSNEVSYFTAFGDDPFSQRQRAFFEGHDIALAHCPVIAGRHPGLYAITLDAEGERTFTYWRVDSAARLLARNLQALRKTLQEHRFVYFSGITLAILDVTDRHVFLDELEANKTREKTFIFDPNYRPSLWENAAVARANIDRAERISDIVLTTFDDEVALHGSENTLAVVNRMKANGIKEFVVKCGPKPAVLFYLGQQMNINAMHDVEVRDTTGAGDSFNGAYIAARMLDTTPAQAVQRAHATAADVVQQYGALLPMQEIVR